MGLFRTSVLEFYLVRCGYNSAYSKGSDLLFLKEDKKAEDFTKYVPGLEIVGEFTEKDKYTEKDLRWARFQWSRTLMEKRLKELYEQTGVADERPTYQICSGVVTWPPQLNLPHIVETPPRASCSPGLLVAWTDWGLCEIESGFCTRIQYPNKGGPTAVPYNERVTVGNEWWLVGTKGDSLEIMTLEIEGSPLSQKIKENLLLNLRNFRRD